MSRRYEAMLQCALKQALLNSGPLTVTDEQLDAVDSNLVNIDDSVPGTYVLSMQTPVEVAVAVEAKLEVEALEVSAAPEALAP